MMIVAISGKLTAEKQSELTHCRYNPNWAIETHTL
jgi:hypothetical protein